MVLLLLLMHHWLVQTHMLEPNYGIQYQGMLVR